MHMRHLSDAPATGDGDFPHVAQSAVLRIVDLGEPAQVVLVGQRGGQADAVGRPGVHRFAQHLVQALNTIERVAMVTMLIIPRGCLIASDGSPSHSQRRWVGDEPAHVLAVQHGRVVPAAGCVDLQ